MPTAVTYDLIGHERLAALVASPMGEEPVVSLYFATGPSSQERRLALKNLVKSGEEAARRDNGFDDERRRRALEAVALVQGAGEEVLHAANQPRGSLVAFVRGGTLETLRLPIVLRDRLVVDRTPYTSPLSSVLDQYERYGVILADQRRGRIAEVYLGALAEWETVDETAVDRKRQTGGGFEGLEEARRRHHHDYVVQRHLQHVAERAFAHHKRHGFSQIIVAGPAETLPKLVDQLHPYLRSRIVAREHWSLELSKHELLGRVIEVERRIEREKEVALLQRVRDHLGGDLLATSGFQETLGALYFAKVATLLVEDGAEAQPGRECPECRYLVRRPEDARAHSPTLVPCPVCNRPMQEVPDVIDQAVELAIQSGAKVEHVAYAKDEIRALGQMAAILRFR